MNVSKIGLLILIAIPVILHAQSAVSVSASPSPAQLGAPVTITATVTPASATGRVTFYDGVTVLGTKSLTSGAASLSTVALPTGIRKLRVYYGGDATNLPATSNIISLTVNAQASAGLLAPVPLGVSGTTLSGVADFNLDGKPDLFGNLPTFSVLLNDGGGSFHVTYQSSPAVNLNAAATGDFNGDGIPDLAVNGMGNVVILLGKGDGTFQPPSSYRAGNGPTALAVADFNGDGKADIASGDFSIGVSILLGNGDGSFQPPILYSSSPSISRTTSILVADFNGDGRPDILASAAGDLRITILLGNGNGTFLPPQTATVVKNPVVVSVGDFNGDGKPDLATGAGDVLLGRGDGTFAAPVNYLPAKAAAFSVVPGDFNGDGITDLALADNSSAALYLLTGKGDGTFQIAQTYNLGFGLSYLTAVGDLNGDGRTDLAIGGNTVRLMFGTSLNLTSTAGNAQSVIITKQFPTALQVTLKDGSTPLSGVTVTFTAPALPGTLIPGQIAPATTPATAALSSTTAVTDANGMASVIATADLYAGTYTVTASAFGVSSQFSLTNLPATLSSIAGAPTASQSTLTGAAFPQALQVTASDPSGIPVSGVTITFTSPASGASAALSATTVVTDAMGMATVTAVANNSPGSYVVNATTGALSVPFPLTNVAPTSTAVTLAATPNPSALGSTITLSAAVTNPGAAGKVTFYDGVTVLGAKSVATGTASLSTSLLSAGVHKLSAYYRDEAARVTGASNVVTQTVKANAGGAFFIQNPAGLTPVPSSTVVADFNNDGRADIAFPRFVIGFGAAVTVMLGKGDGTFQAPVDYLVGVNGAFFAATGDFNGDGNTDIAVTTVDLFTSGVTVLIGNGDGTFRSRAVYSSGATANIGPLVVGDFNSDGKADVLIAYIGSNSLSFNLLPGAGDGSLGPPQTYATLPPASGIFYPSMLTADFNGDGKPDLAVGGALGVATPFVLSGSGNGTPLGTLSAFNPDGITFFNSLVAGDFNGDGNPDIAVGGVSGNVSATWVFLGKGDGTFQPGVKYALGSAVRSTDINGDGFLDLVVVGSAGGNSSLLGKGDGTFRQGLGFSPGVVLAVADFNNDGYADILVSSPINISVLLGAASVTNASGPPASIAVNGAASHSTLVDTPFPQPLQIIVKDANGQPVGGAAVTFAVPPTGASAVLSSVTALTNASGIASLTATANNIPGAYPVTATVNGLSTSFTLTNLLGGKTDLALGKTATQSSDLPGYPSDTASAALDGNTDGNFFAGSVTHTGFDNNAWWQVDLGTSSTIDSIVIWNRTDCCVNRLNDYWVFVSDTPFSAADTPATLQGRPGIFSSHQLSPPNPQATVAVNGAQGRYVRVQLSGADNLSLAEVQVIAKSPESNLALARAATQSGSYLPATVAGLAVDGNTDGSYDNGSVSHTNFVPNAWWQVDLGASATINSVVIWNRTDACCISRLGDYWVFVSDAPFSATDTPSALQTRPGTLAIHRTTAPNPSDSIAIGAQGRYIRVQLTTTLAQALNLAEVQVFGTGGATPLLNLSTGRAASQSSTLPGYSTDGAASAVDGNTDGSFFDGSVTHTNLEANPWWQVDLGAAAAVNSVVIWNRTDACCVSRLVDYWVFVSNTPFGPNDTLANLVSRPDIFASHQLGLPSPSRTVAVSAPGRYVRIQLGSAGYLNLAEVQVFGTGGAPAATNLAVNKVATQSSTLPDYPTTGAAKAVDGNTDGGFFNGSVTHTNPEANAWWQVDLGTTPTINSVVVWNRTDCCSDRLNDYWVFASNTPFAATDTPTTLQGRANTFASHQTAVPSPSTTINVAQAARYVRVQLSGTNPLSLAEVQVFGQ